MSPIRTVLFALVASAAAMQAACGTSEAARGTSGITEASVQTAASPEYPDVLLGNWMPRDMACPVPINHDSDVLMVIERRQLGRHEESNKPVGVLPISSDPQAWSVDSLLNVGGDGYDIRVSEVFVLVERNLVITGERGIEVYQRCD